LTASECFSGDGVNLSASLFFSTSIPSLRKGEKAVSSAEGADTSIASPRCSQQRCLLEEFNLVGKNSEAENQITVERQASLQGRGKEEEEQEAAWGIRLGFLATLPSLSFFTLLLLFVLLARYPSGGA
jgi:hypothetical protein